MRKSSVLLAVVCQSNFLSEFESAAAHNSVTSHHSNVPVVAEKWQKSAASHIVRHQFLLILKQKSLILNLALYPIHRLDKVIPKNFKGQKLPPPQLIKYVQKSELVLLFIL